MQLFDGTTCVGFSQTGEPPPLPDDIILAYEQLLKALEESGQADNTIVIFSADNGPEQYAYARDANFDHCPRC